MNFCSDCGAKAIVERIPEGDNRMRYVCDACGRIHYQNPRIIAGCLPIYQDQVLLCKRAIEPRYGLWTLPAGFMENGESVEEGAMRETWEEAQAKVKIISLQSQFSLPHISQVYMLYLAELTDLNFAAGTESLDVRLYQEADIPWEQLAFPVIKLSLENYFADRKQGEVHLHRQTLQSRRYARKDSE